MEVGRRLTGKQSHRKASEGHGPHWEGFSVVKLQEPPTLLQVSRAWMETISCACHSPLSGRLDLESTPLNSNLTQVPPPMSLGGASGLPAGH